MNFTRLHLLVLSEFLHLESFFVIRTAMFDGRSWIYRSNSQISTEVNGLEGFDTIPFEESFAGKSLLLRLVFFQFIRSLVITFDVFLPCVFRSIDLDSWRRNKMQPRQTKRTAVSLL